MKKPQDSDIFGTKSLGYAPRIVNQQQVDPNLQFQINMEAQFNSYSQKVGSTHKPSFANKTEQTKVNEQAQFNENYHRSRKEADLQSSIFYEPPPSTPNPAERPRITQRVVPKHAYNAAELSANFGKKETLNREVKALAENQGQFKGNSSNIFGLEEKS
jgi:hypothetical protein